jgi:hypothetical protein
MKFQKSQEIRSLMTTFNGLFIFNDLLKFIFPLKMVNGKISCDTQDRFFVKMSGILSLEKFSKLKFNSFFIQNIYVRYRVTEDSKKPRYLLHDQKGSENEESKARL